MRTNRIRRPAPPIPRETLEICDRRELLIAGVLGILEYSEQRVCIRTTGGAVTVCGNALTLCWAGEKRLLLRGDMEAITFSQKRKEKNR